jgi:hypothetical protein
VRGRCVAWFSRVHDEHAASGPGQDQRRGQTGGSAADDQHLEFAHAVQSGRAGTRPQLLLPFPGKPRSISPWLTPAQSLQRSLSLRHAFDGLARSAA